MTSEPFDKDLVGKIAQNLGEITLYTAGIALDEPSPKPDQNAVLQRISGVSYSSEKNKSEIVVTPDNKGKKKEVLGPDFTVGTTPESTGSFDREITFGTPLKVVDWKSGEPEQVGAVLSGDYAAGGALQPSVSPRWASLFAEWPTS